MTKKKLQQSNTTLTKQKFHIIQLVALTLGFWTKSTENQQLSVEISALNVIDTFFDFFENNVLQNKYKKVFKNLFKRNKRRGNIPPAFEIIMCVFWNVSFKRNFTIRCRLFLPFYDTKKTSHKIFWLIKLLNYWLRNVINLW